MVMLRAALTASVTDNGYTVLNPLLTDSCDNPGPVGYVQLKEAVTAFQAARSTTYCTSVAPPSCQQLLLLSSSVQ